MMSFASRAERFSAAGAALAALKAGSVLLCLLAGAVSGQMRIDVTGVGAALTPITIGDFQQQDPRLKQQVAQIIRSNLSGSGLSGWSTRVGSRSQGRGKSIMPRFAALASTGRSAVWPRDLPMVRLIFVID